MKLLYSQLKALVPGLKATPKEVAGALTLTGSMMDDFKEVRYRGRKDYLIGLEIRQNRPDCLSVIGLAREVAAYYGLKVKLPRALAKLPSAGKKPDIKVGAEGNVKRILAVRMEGVKNKKSPGWLKELLELYEINSVNLIVDLSNYVMLMCGYPSHILDEAKIDGQLKWAMNKDFKKITTLDGSNIELGGGELIIRDDKKVLALAGIVGGKAARIDLKTDSIVMETAIYSHSVIRNNARSLNIVTEASNRLTKELDPNGSDLTLKLLVSQILENCGGKVVGKIFEYYPKKYKQPEIRFDPSLPSAFSGINIPEAKSIQVLKRLDFKVKKAGKKFLVTAPVTRTDVSLEEDVIDEVVRMFGYDRIPSDEVPKLQVVGNITPPHVKLEEKIRDVLTSSGFDEILSWPLVQRGDNERVNYLDWDIVYTQNSMNEDYPALRQSAAAGLINQSNEYLKKNIEYIKIFEMGKVFGKKGKKYQEHDSAGILLCTSSRTKGLPEIKGAVENLLRSIGFADIRYSESKKKPKVANPYSCWDITAEGKGIGIIYKLNPQKPGYSAYFAEINVEEATKLLQKISRNPAVELTQKLIVLDANVELKEKDSIADFMDKMREKINPKHIWSMVVVDRFPLKEKIRYTVRVSYMGLSDPEAKKIHLKSFGLLPQK